MRKTNQQNTTHKNQRAFPWEQRGFLFSAFYLLFSNRSRRGEALIEALVALGILMVGFLGIMELLSRSLSLNRVVAQRYAASYLAAEGIEVVKNISDTNIVNNPGDRNAWRQGLDAGSYEAEYGAASLEANNTRNFYFDSATGLYDYSGFGNTPFRRRVEISHPNADEMKVNSIVDWITRGGGSFTVNVEDHFYNWRP